MRQTSEFLAQAQACLEKVLLTKRPELLAAYGKIELEIKPDNTPVTELDRAFETELREALKSLDNGIGLEGEEFGVEGNRDTFWLIDPIDGTENFLRGLPFVRNMVTLIDQGEPVFCLVYKPISDELLTATKGRDAYKDGQKLRVSQRPMERTWIELSARPSEAGVSEVLAAVSRRIHGFRTIGDFTYVAEGKVDGHLIYKAGGGPWDYAPRGLLLQEAGARVTNIGSQVYDYRQSNMLAANPAIFDELMSIIVGAKDSV